MTIPGTPPPPTPAPKSALRSMILGGLIPVILFTLVEEYYGTLWGLIAGMVFGVGEIIYEWRRTGRVETITWAANGLILILGGVSLLTNEGVWFKLQPALIEVAMAFFLFTSVAMGKPLLVMLARKQGTFDAVPEAARARLEKAMGGLTTRIGIFFLLHSVLATWAALHWSTRNWALLKGLGFTLSLFLYMAIEAVLLRRRLKN